MANDFISIKGVQRLSDFKHHKIGDIYNVVYRTHSDGAETVFQPLRRFFHGDVVDSDAGVTGTVFFVLDSDVYAFAHGVAELAVKRKNRS